MVSTTSWICEKKKNLMLKGQHNAFIRFGFPKDIKEGSKGVLGNGNPR